MREKQTQREAAMDKEELVFTTIEVEGERRTPDAAEEGDSRSVFHG